MSRRTKVLAQIRHTRAVRRRVSRQALRSRRTPEGLELWPLVAAEVVCVLTWVLTGVSFALMAALVAGLGLVRVAVAEDAPPQRQRRVR